MRKLILAGVAAGAALGAGVVGAIDLATPEANAQRGGDVVTQAQLNNALRSANQRASAAINGYKTANNVLTKYFIPQGQLIGARSGPIRQDRGTGANGLPTETIQNLAITRAKLANQSVNSEKIEPGGVTSGDLADNSVTGEKINPGAVSTEKIPNGAVTNQKLSPDVQSQLNTIYTAAIFNAPGQEPSLERGKGAESVARVDLLPVGAFDVTFANNISQCTWTASVATVQPGAVVPVFQPFVPYTTLLNNNTLRVFTFLSTNGTLQDAPFNVHVIC